MLVRITRFWQVAIAVIVTSAILFLIFFVGGPDIDGRTPALADVLQGIAISAIIVGAFVVAAVALYRGHRLGWWMSIVLDGLLGSAAVSMVVGDFQDRYMATEMGREAFRDDLLLHATILLICVIAIVLLLLTYRAFLSGEPASFTAPPQSPSDANEATN